MCALHSTAITTVFIKVHIQICQQGVLCSSTFKQRSQVQYVEMLLQGEHLKEDKQSPFGDAGVKVVGSSAAGDDLSNAS